MTYVMKGIAGLLLGVVAYSSFSKLEFMKIAWYSLFPITWVIFGLDAYFVKENKKIEFQIYDLENEEQQSRIEIARLMSEKLPEAVLNREIPVPNRELSLPVIYYVIITALTFVGFLVLGR